jgi:hypothetical protein
MIKFDRWRGLNEDVENPVPQPRPAPAATTVAPATPAVKIKPWKAGKDEIMNFWKGVQTNMPFALKPISYDHKGSTIQEDGLRITGSKEFIQSVLSRLKDFMIYENPDTKLMVSYRQSPKSLTPGNRNSYTFYLQVKQRGKK